MIKKCVVIFSLIFCLSIHAQTAEQELLAIQGNAEAQNALGEIYLEAFYDNDDESSAKKALNWFQQAAKKGNADAMYHLGEMYLDGFGVQESQEQGMQWINKAANNNQADALYYLGYLAFDAENYPKAEAFYIRAASLGHEEAAEELADEYLSGAEFTESLPKAMKWYEVAANAGSARAMAIMGKLYFYGKGLTPSDSKAKHWFEKAYIKEHSAAAVGLGNLYRLGRGVTQSDKKAIEYYTIATEIDEYQAEALYYLTQYALANKIADKTALIDQLLDSVSRSGSVDYTVGGVNANLLLGQLFAKGKFIQQSDDAALGSFASAADAGDNKGYEKVAVFYASDKGDKDYASIGTIACASHWLAKQTDNKYIPLIAAFEARFEKDLGKEKVEQAKQMITVQECFNDDIILSDIINTANY